MPEFFDIDPSDDERDLGEDVEKFEPDPGTVAFLDQEAAAFREIEGEFAKTYGFEHQCHCDSDYAEGRVGEVTECFAGMVTEALATCASFKYENDHLKTMVAQLLEINGQLTDQIVGDGATVSDDILIQAELDSMAGDEPDAG